MRQNIFHRHNVLIFGLYSLLVIFLSFFNPYDLPALMLLLPFLLFFAASFLLLRRVLIFVARKLQLETNASKLTRIAFVCSGAPTFLVLLQSIGQVGPYDIVVTGVLFFAADLFLARSKFRLFKSAR